MDRLDPETIYFVVQQIPRGKVTTYGHVAFLANYPNNARQVGQILKHLPSNPDLDYSIHNVPWQRVIRSGGVVPQRPGYEEHVQVLGQEVEVVDGRVSMAEYGWFPEELNMN